MAYASSEPSVTLEDTPDVELGDTYLLHFCGGSHEQKKSDATKEKRNEVFKIWKLFVLHVTKAETTEYPPFLLIKEGETFTNSVDWSVVRNFLSYYLHHLGGKSVTQSQWKKALDALQDWVNSNLLGLGYSPAQKGLVRGNNVVKSISSSSINSGKAKLKDDMNTDIQADLLRSVSPAQKLFFIDQCYQPTKTTTARMCALTRLQVAVAFTLSSCTLQRSEHVRGLKYKFSLTRELAQLGPGAGTECLLVVKNDGKTNKNGHIEAAAVAPHK
jgi:hypothetical protein